MAVVAIADGEQVQVMVAQYRDGPVAQSMDKAQTLQRLGSAVDQVTNKPEPVACPVEVDVFQQSQERIMATLQIANGVDGLG